MARARTYIAHFTEHDINEIKRIARRTKTSKTLKTRCAILLRAHRCQFKEPYEQMALKLNVSTPTVITTLKNYCIYGLNEALFPHRSIKSETHSLKATGRVEAYLLALACMQRMHGEPKRSLSTLATVIFNLLHVKISRSTVFKILQNSDIRPHVNPYWRLRRGKDDNFIEQMSSILDLYEQPYDERSPLWCMDERPYIFPNHSQKANIFCFMQPHTGKIVTFVEASLNSKEWAYQVKLFVDSLGDKVNKVTLVMDNLNTHRISSLFKSLPHELATNLAERLEFRYTPKHGSWLNMAEIGLKLLTQYCFTTQFYSIDELRYNITIWKDWHNSHIAKVKWQYVDKHNVRHLQSLYPKIILSF